VNSTQTYLTPADCWFLTGPTASGKTSLALDLAASLGAEIISLDSMAIYRGMSIGTAKPTAAEQAQVPHHLIDIVDPHEEYSVAQYVEAAEKVVRQIVSQGRVPLFVGGTPLYLKALLRGIFAGPPADWELRARLDALADAEGDEELHRRLAKVDPISAKRLHARDRRRVIRALEVFEKTGRGITEWQQQFERARPAEDCRVFLLDWPREQLVERMDRRVDAMFDAGLLVEAEALLGRPFPPGRTASQAVGYREALAHLRGELGLAETIALVKLRTRQFAKRQMTWFRSLSELRRISAASSAEGLVQTILSLPEKK
jgi:tRNA dimethylallyltransferase